MKAITIGNRNCSDPLHPFIFCDHQTLRSGQFFRRRIYGADIRVNNKARK